MLPGQIGWSAPRGEDALIRRIADLERSFRELGPSIASSFSTTVAQLNAAVAQLNAASESKTSSFVFTSVTTPDSQTARTNYDAVTVTFTKPAWATRGNILAFSTFSGADSATAGFVPAVWTRIFGVDSGTSSVQVPNQLEVRNAGAATSYVAYDVAPAPTVIPFTQSFLTGAATTASASLRLTKAFSGGTSSFACSITATVFWTAV